MGTPASGSNLTRPAMNFAAAVAQGPQDLRARQEASRRERTSEYALFVYMGKLNRSPMDQPTFGRFYAAITGVVLDNASSDHPTLLEVHHTSWSAKARAGVIYCANEVTQEWFIQAVGALQIPERDASILTFRAWKALEQEADTAHVNVKGLGLEHDQVLRLIQVYNPWLAGGVTATSGEFRTGRVSGDPLMELHITDEAAVQLATRKLPWRLHLGLETRMVIYRDCEGLARRLEAADHDLAGQFRASLRLPQVPQELLKSQEPRREGSDVATDTSAAGATSS